MNSQTHNKENDTDLKRAITRNFLISLLFGGIAIRLMYNKQELIAQIIIILIIAYSFYELHKASNDEDDQNLGLDYWKGTSVLVGAGIGVASYLVL